MGAQIINLADHLAKKQAAAKKAKKKTAAKRGYGGPLHADDLPERKVKKRKPKAKRAAKAKIQTSREVPVRVTRCPDRDYQELVGYLTIDRVDGEVVRVTFDPILDDHIASFDMDAMDFEYKTDGKKKRQYRVRDIDDGKWWTFSRMVKVG